MGEPRGKLEQLIAELEGKKAEVERMLQEFDLILPHLQQSLEALNKAGFTDSSGTEVKMPDAAQIQEIPRPEQGEQSEEPEAADQQEAAKKKQAAEQASEQEAAEQASEQEAAEEKEGEKKSAKRSIASLVGGGD